MPRGLNILSLVVTAIRNARFPSPCQAVDQQGHWEQRACPGGVVASVGAAAIPTKLLAQAQGTTGPCIPTYLGS